jgi:AAA domain (dynein-related subfamily)
MPATAVLQHDIVFDNVPVTSTLRGFALPYPAILRIQPSTGSPNTKDKEWDGRSASLKGNLVWNKTQRTHYLATIACKAVGKAGFTKTIVAVREVTQPDWLAGLQDWSDYLVNNAENFTSTHKAVIANLGRYARTASLTGARPAPAATLPSVIQSIPVPTPPVPMPAASQSNGALPMKSWDPNDLDIAHDLFEVPADNTNFLPDAETFKILDAQWELAMANDEPRMVLIYGDTSTGKTEHPIIWAARRDVLHCRIDCGAFGEIYDVTGPIKASEKNGVPVTEWVKGKTIRAMADPRPAVIQLDEVNRISDVKAMNVLFPYLDSARQSYFDDAQTWMKLNGVKLIIATMNGDTRGDDIGEYVGTQPLDQAFISRFPVRRQLRYPDADKLARILKAHVQGAVDDGAVEQVAQIAVELVALNKFVPNLRELFATLDFLAKGVDIYHALKWTVGGIYKDDGTAACDFTSFKAVLIGKNINVDEA